MISIKVPPLGESIVEATVARWSKHEGDAVTQGETIVELETDKITVEVPAPESGALAKVLHQEGDVVKVDDELGQIDETARAVSTAKVGLGNSAAVATAATAAAPAAPVTRASPAARRVAEESGVDLSAVAGTARGGLVTKADVLATRAGTQSTAPSPSRVPGAESPLPSPESRVPGPEPRTAVPESRVPSPDGLESRIPMSTRRKRIAQNLVQAQQATAHLTTFNEVDMSAVIGVRERLKERIEKQHGVRLTFMPFFAKAVCMAIETSPVVNAAIDGDTIVYRHYVNLGIAVASDQGLVVPVVRDAHRKGMIEFARDLSAIAARAREGKLTMDDLTGGTFTITNGGVFGSLVSTPILNYPQVGILGLHKIQDRPVAIGRNVEIRPMMYLALSYDHWLVDGQQAVLFLVRVKELMEDPAAMLVD